MSRNSIVRPYLVRHLLRNTIFSQSMIRSSSSSNQTLISSFATQSRPFSSFTSPKIQPFYQCSGNIRTFSSPPSGSSKIESIVSEEQFNNTLSKVRDESLPALFYFTAAWCGPCRLIAPKINEWSNEYPHVAIYKIDIDQDGMENTLRKLDVTAVPTFLFYRNGKSADKVVGATLEKLLEVMKRLYKTE